MIIPDRDSVVLRELASQAFSRAAGAPLVAGNSVRLLKDAAQNYPAWLEAIQTASRSILFDSYIVHEDEIGYAFADELIAKAREGITVRLVYDWLGALNATSRAFWNRLRAGGVQVRCFNPPQVTQPLGWVSRDHRKMLAVDGRVGFVTGLCIGRMWVGDPARGLDPWRDTGVEVRGPAVADIERAFAQVWAMIGEPIAENELACGTSIPDAGEKTLRVIANVPSTTKIFRLDQLVCALARKSLWLTDAYYAGTAPYVQALRAAAADGVDVRLLVPGATDIPVLRPLSRAGFRPLLDAGVRVFEWNGSMLHAKTAVADGVWARVGSSNLNIASWMGNCELDVAVEDTEFGKQMEDMYVEDLKNSTELVLDSKFRTRSLGVPAPHAQAAGYGSAGRATTGMLRIGNAVGAAITGHRELGPVEAQLMITAGMLFLAIAIVMGLWPAIVLYPAVVIAVWFGAAFLYNGWSLYRKRKRSSALSVPRPAGSAQAGHR
ncbi:MAG TPA: phospholipase D-like domain-containing protein [Bryobacteraceae bacterium]|nr:phospholipase D-like domain-containing protein [Bryobacteraceae bacterium]